MNTPERPVTSDDIADFVRRGHRRYLVRGWIAVVVCLGLSSALLGGALVLRPVVAVAAFPSDGPATSPAATGTTSASPSSSASSHRSVSVTDITPGNGGSGNGGSTDKLAPPTKLTHKFIGPKDAPQSIVLTWSPPLSGPEVVRYDILKDGELFDMVTAPTVEWEEKWVGPTHVYKVRAVAQDDVSATSDPLTVTFKQSEQGIDSPEVSPGPPTTDSTITDSTVTDQSFPTS